MFTVTTWERKDKRTEIFTYGIFETEEGANQFAKEKEELGFYIRVCYVNSNVLDPINPNYIKGVLFKKKTQEFKADTTITDTNFTPFVIELQ